jgi:HK97 family phage portal protein
MAQDTRPSLIARARTALARRIAPKRAIVTRNGQAFFVSPANRPPEWNLHAGAKEEKSNGYYSSVAPYGGAPNPAVYQSYAEEGFGGNALIYAAIMYKARASSYVPLRVFTGDVEDATLVTDPNDPLVRLTVRPNDYQSWAEFMALNIAYENIAGESFIWIGRDANGVANALYPLRPDRMYILAEDKVERDFKTGEAVPRRISGYAYQPSGMARDRAMIIETEDIIHTIFTNPVDELQGMGHGFSPIRSMAKSGDVDNKLTDFIKQFFDNGAMFAGIVRAPDHRLEENIVARIRDRFNALYGGYDNWSSVAVLDKDLEYERIGLSFEEMGTESLDRRNSARILMPFGVPGALISEPSSLDRATYSNLEILRRIFWEDTFKPELTAFQDQFQFALNLDEYFVRFDFSGVPALMVDKPEMIKAATEMWKTGVPADIAYRTMGVEMPSWPGSDVSFIPVSYMPFGAPIAAQVTEVVTDDGAVVGIEQEEAPPPSDDLSDTQIRLMLEILDRLQQGLYPPLVAQEALVSVGVSPDRARRMVDGLIIEDSANEPGVESKAVDDAQKRRVGQTIRDSADKFIPDFLEEARNQFELDMRAILARTKGIERANLERKQAVNYQELLLDWRQYLTMADERWREAFAPLVAAVVSENGEALSNIFGLEFDVRNLLAEQWFQDYLLEFAQPIMDTTEKDLSALLEQAQREGWSIQKIQEHVQTLFRQYMDGGLTPEQFEWFDSRMPNYRSEMIARTETIRSSNAGSLGIYKQWGAPFKEWLATGDERTREAHTVAGANYTEGGSPGPIPIDDPFIVNGYRMMFPGDASMGAPPSEFINCRCAVVPFGDFVNV